MRSKIGAKNMRRILAIVAFGLALFVGLIGFGNRASAGVPAGVPSGVSTAAQAAKIDPTVLQDTADGKSASVMLLLADQADVQSANTMKDQDARGWYVYNTLTKHAERTQAALRASLDAQGIRYTSFWAVNAIVMTVDRPLLESLAARNDVGKIESNKSTRWIEDPKIANFQPSTDSPNAIELGVTNVNAPQVWAQGFRGQGIVIGGLDTGIRWTHNAIKNQYRGWNGTTADHNYNWHDAIHSGGGACGPNSIQPCDDNQHGTHTVGTVVGDDGNPGTNQIGVAPAAKWVGCRNMDQGNGTPATYTECFQWTIAPTDLNGNNPNPALRPHVLNNSWGCPTSEGCAANSLETIVNNTQAAGIFVVVSAGNSGPSCGTVNTPAAIYEASFSVGAISASTNAIVGFSSRGPVTVDGSNRLKPNISAPGSNVRSATNGSDTAYGSLSGTSMAGPHVAGVAALLWSARPQLVRDIANTKLVLQNTANPNVVVSPVQICGGIPSTDIPNNTFGYGRIDALAAVNSVSQGTPTASVTVGVATATRTNTAVAPTSTVGATGTAVATATCAPSGPLVFTGSIDGTEPVHNSVNGAVSTCGGTTPCPGELLGIFHYDTYPLNNTSGAAVCITVTLSDTTCIYSEVYAAVPAPGNSCIAYVADSNLGASYQVTIPAFTTYFLVVEEFTENAGCGSYTVTVTGLSGGICATGTPVATVAATSTTQATVAATSTRTNTVVVSTSTTQATVAATSTRTAVVTTVATSTGTVGVASVTATTSVATATTVPCTVTFTDVDETSTFYTWIRCLACRGIISGYSDGTFRPNNEISRGQIAKMVSNSAGFGEDPGAQIYEDVPPASPFYSWINRLSMRGHMGGYNCGIVPEEPCLVPERPYFRPAASATRGQLAKIVANAAGLSGTPSGIFYTDVQEDHPFYVWIMRLTTLGVMSGYPCGGPNEPCDESNRPYFRPYASVTRGQASKIVANTFFPNCQTPQRGSINN